MSQIADTLPKEVVDLFCLLHRARVYREGQYTGNVVTLRALLLSPLSGLYGDELNLLPGIAQIGDTLARAQVYGYARREPALNRAQERDPVWTIFDLFSPEIAKAGRGALPIVMAPSLTIYLDKAEDLHQFEFWLRGWLSERPGFQSKIKALAAHVAP